MTSGALAGALETEFPEVDAGVRVRRIMESAIAYEGKGFDRWSFVADPDVLSFFGFPLVEGDPRTALSQPFSVVLSRQMATDLFGGDDPIGKRVQLTSTYHGGEYTVTGILGDLGKTFMRADFLLSPTINEENEATWTGWRPCSERTTGGT